jgi:hypothetical protein
MGSTSDPWRHEPGQLQRERPFNAMMGFVDPKGSGA